MRLVVQRVSRSAVRVDGVVVGEIGHGLMVLVAFTHTDTDEVLSWMVNKLIHLRVMEDSDGKMNLSVQDTGGGILLIPQFTLYGDIRRGFRPSFTSAALPDIASPLFDRFYQLVTNSGVLTEKGIFGADMQVELVNDGPVTILLER